MRVRPMELTDIEQIVELENQTWTSLNTPVPLPVASKEKIIKRFEEQTHFMVAEENEKILGVLSYQPYYPHLPSGHHVVTFGIAVSKEKRGLGIGRQLVNSFFINAKADGYQKVLIHVLSTNDSAAAFYQKLGFCLEARLAQQFYLNGHYADDLIYSYYLEVLHAK